MGTVASQPGIVELLETAGARPAGARRYDCLGCGARRTVSADESKGVFYCHHAGCDFHGGIGTLRRRLGIRREWLSRAEYLRQKREREQARQAAEWLAERVRERRFELYEAHRSLARIGDSAKAKLGDNPQDETAWSALAYCYTEFPRGRAELLILEAGPVRDIVAFLKADRTGRALRVDQVICQGGLVSYEGKFLELGSPA